MASSSLEKTSTLGRKLSVQVEHSDVSNTFHRFFVEIQKDTTIKGFRPGKAPLNTIKQLYSDRVKQDVAEELIRQNLAKALQEHSLDPVTYPEFEFDAPDIEKSFAFSALFEIRPTIELRRYEGLELTKEKFTLDQSRIDKIVENIQNSHATWADLLIERPVQLGDQAIIDFTGFVDGAPLPNGSGTSFPLELGRNQFIEGFEDGIVGMKIGEERTLNLKFPKNYSAAEIAGKPVEFKVSLRGIKKKDLPELNEEFLKTKLGGIESIEKLRGEITKDIEASERKRIDADLKNELLKQLVKFNPIDVPQALIEEQRANLVEDMRKRTKEQGMQEEEFQEYLKKWDADFSNTAREMVQAGFLIDTIAEKNNLTASREDVEKKLDDYVQQTGIDREKITGFYDRPEQARKLTYQITEDKVVAFLLARAKVTEIEKPASAAE